VKKPSTELRDYWNSEPDDDPSTAKTVTYVPKVINSAEDKIADRIKAYEKDFDVSSLTEGDKSQIKNLARIEVSIESLTERLSSIGESDPKDAKSLSDTLASLMGQHRQLAAALGIDRKSRTNRGDSEYQEYLPRLHREAQEFLERYSVVIMCPACIAQQARIQINQGLIIFHFANNVDWSWTSNCPRCNEKFTINQSNYQKFTRAALSEINDATPQENTDTDE
jgi:hypothetical protein